MDPPASPTSSATHPMLKEKVVMRPQHELLMTEEEQKPSTPTTKNTNDSSSPYQYQSSHYSPSIATIATVKSSNNSMNNPGYNTTTMHQQSSNSRVVNVQQQQQSSSCTNPPPPPPIHRSRNAAKIIKGEIHNVLTVMRSDSRYYSTNGASIDNNKKKTHNRFEYEERQSQSFAKDSGWNYSNSNSNNNSRTISSHPILQGLRDLHDLLSIMEVEGGSSRHLGWGTTTNNSSSGTAMNSSQTTNKLLQKMNAVTFVSPFAAAVSSKDVDAKTTGEALSALHKFIVYGFIGGGHDDEKNENRRTDDILYSSSMISGIGSNSHRFPFFFSSSHDKICESISVVAQCIRHCSFEDSTSKALLSSSNAHKGKRIFSFWSSSDADADASGNNPILGSRSDSVIDKLDHDLPSFLVQRRRTEKSKGGKEKKTDRRSIKPYSSLSPSDEDVVLKLLSLSVQVLRCPAGRNLLSPQDVIGIFDTCLYVAIAAGEANRSLLRSAAADALSHCVIVVFGMRGGVRPSKKKKKKKKKYGIRSDRRGDDITDDPITNDDDSDDDWGERDPTEDLMGADELVRPSPDEEDEKSSTDANVNANVPITFAKREGEENNNKTDSITPQEEEPALVAIMHRLTALADPLIHEDDTCVLALSLVNIALETMSDVDALSVRYPRLLTILQNDLCRCLLRLSASADLAILGLALRVIFNLFNGIKDHLKVQLEVFLTSVHLRTLSFTTSPNSKERVWSSSPERRELALESLLEFCREPMLMLDLYLNYDCDINATNLFETICSTLSKVANPEDEIQNKSTSDTESEVTSNEDGGGSDDIVEQYQKPRLNILNRLALEGVLAVIDGIARRCASSKPVPLPEIPENTALLDENDITCPSPPDSGNSAFLGNTLYIRRDSVGSGSVNDSSEYDFCSIKSGLRPSLERDDSEMSEDVEWLSKARHHTSLALRERKLRKRRIAKAAVEFNEQSKDKVWIAAIERLGLLPTPATAKSIASFLYSTPKLDKTKIGLYLSKGPKEKYPFHSEVLDCFASLFNFHGMSFSEAMRTFLGSFRLPGEAQCIDRLMEAFATRLYDVQMSLGTNAPGDVDQSVEETMLDPPRRENSMSESEFSSRTGSRTLDPPASSEEVDPVFPFKSSDAAFILSFSTIMLNTDLHNPNMKDEKRMTQEQFVRNNRGINDGEDLPKEFLNDLYYEIKTNEIQVNQDLMQDGGGSADAFDGILANANNVATPFFTNHSAQVQAGVHERDMYVSISSAAISAISTVFVESWDDVLVTKALEGLRNAAYICSYFGLNEQFNHILELVLGFGLDYVGSVSALLYTPPECGQSTVIAATVQSLEEDNDQAVADLEAELVSRNIPPLPKAFLNVLNNDTRKVHMELSDMTGSAAHRGLLSLQCALALSKHYFSLVNEAWPQLLDVMFALRDVNALPPTLSDLDDFANSLGNQLPMSVFAHRSQQRVSEYMQSIAPSVNTKEKSGFLSSVFATLAPLEAHDGDSKSQLVPLSETLQRVANNSQFDKIIMKTNDAATAKRILCALLESVFPDGDTDELASDPLFEHNSVFVLELSARLLISNRIYAAELYPIFLAKFQQLLSPQLARGAPEGTESVIYGLKFPYVLERIVVTILRACIHLFDMPEPRLRDQLNRSLNLIAALPSTYTRAISDRIGCGAAIILRGCFYLFDDSTDDWSTIKSLLDLAAQDKSSRSFVFDGIASVIDGIDYAIPSTTDGQEEQVVEDENEVQLSQNGVKVMASLLLKFMNGSYEDDTSFNIPAMTYIKKVYSFSQHFSDKTNSDDGSANNDSHHLQETEFETMVDAIYIDACLSQDGTTAKRGFESLQGVVMSTPVDSLPVSKWFAFLKQVATNPPSIEVEEARISSLSLIGRLFLTLMPELSNSKENWSMLEEWTISVASIVSDNLQAGRASSLFETTVQTVTNVVNVMSMSGFNEGNEEGVNFCNWVGETLLFELEKSGATGGVYSIGSPTNK